MTDIWEPESLVRLRRQYAGVVRELEDVQKEQANLQGTVDRLKERKTRIEGEIKIEEARISGTPTTVTEAYYDGC